MLSEWVNPSLPYRPRRDPGGESGRGSARKATDRNVQQVSLSKDALKRVHVIAQVRVVLEGWVRRC